MSYHPDVIIIYFFFNCCRLTHDISVENFNSITDTIEDLNINEIALGKTEHGYENSVLNLTSNKQPNWTLQNTINSLASQARKQSSEISDFSVTETISKTNFNYFDKGDFDDSIFVSPHSTPAKKKSNYQVHP